MPYVIMVRCPNADKAVSTGIHCDLKGFSALTEPPPLECPECRQIHEWSLDDAWLRDAGFDELVLLSAHNIAPITEHLPRKSNTPFALRCNGVGIGVKRG